MDGSKIPHDGSAQRLGPLWAWGWGALLILLTAVIYAPSIDGPFVFDDIDIIEKNEGIRDLGRLSGVLNSGVLESRPVFLLTLAVNYWVHGLRVQGYHLTNIVLHALTALLVFWLARRMARDLERAPQAAEAVPPGGRLSGSRGGSELAALLFVVHPAATESVAYINGRPGVLVAMFGICSLLVLLSGQDEVRPPWRFFKLLLSFVLLLLAMGSKESAVVLPLVIVLYLWIIRGSAALRQAWQDRTLVLPLVAWLVVPLLYLFADNPHEAALGPHALPFFTNLMTQVRALVSLFWLSCYPLEQNFDHDFRPTTTLMDPAFWLGGAVLLTLLVLALRGRRRAPVLALSVLGFFLALAPTNSVLPFKEFMAERYLYLSLMFFSLGAGQVLAQAVALLSPVSGRVRTPWPRAALLVSLVILVTAFTLLSRQRAQVLSNPLLLWQEAAELSPNKARPNLNYGIELARRGEVDRGRVFLQRALALDPSYRLAYYNLGLFHELNGNYLKSKKKWTEAEAAYLQAEHLYASAGAAADRARMAHLRRQMRR